MSAPNAAQNTVGYRCSVCGTWVPMYPQHSCGSTSTYPTVTVQPTPGELLIAAVLNRIADALERRAAGTGDGQ